MFLFREMPAKTILVLVTVFKKVAEMLLFPSPTAEHLNRGVIMRLAISGFFLGSFFTISCFFLGRVSNRGLHQHTAVSSPPPLDGRRWEKKQKNKIKAHFSSENQDAVVMSCRGWCK